MAPWWLRSQIDEEVAHQDDAAEASPQHSTLSEIAEASPDPAPAQASSPEASEAAEAPEGEQAAEAGDGRRRRRRRRRRRGGATRASQPPSPELENIAEETEARAAAAQSSPAKDQSPESREPKIQVPESQVSESQASDNREPVTEAELPKPERRKPESSIEARSLEETAKEERSAESRPSRPAPQETDAPSRRAERVESKEPEDDVESLSSGVLYVPERSQSNADERKIAMFLDFENIALGVRDSETKSFDVSLILERLLEKGKIVVKRAYADWERYSEYKRPLHEAAIELIDIPQKHYSGKNSADIKMVVDAIDLCYAKDHLDTFVLVTGDSDFSPLVSKLKENDKYVIGLGVKNSTSHLLIDNCDEFIYYEDVWRDTQRAPRLDHLPPKEAACFQLMSEAMLALFREGKDVIWGSQLKQTIKRKRPSFSEGYYGYSTFSEMLEDAERKNIVRLRRDRRSGGYIVAGFATRPKR